MTTTHTDLAVAGEITAESLTQRLLEPTTALPRAPRDKYVRQLVRSVRCGKATPVSQIVAIVDDQLARGCSPDAVARFADDFRTYVFARAKSLRPACTRTLRSLLLEEARAEGIRNLAEIELHADPTNPQLRERFLSAAARYRDADAALTAAVQHQAAPIEAAYPQTVRATYTRVTARVVRETARA